MLEKLNKYAELAVKIGVNIQEGQMLVINSPVECKDFTRLIVENGFKAGASDVMVRWNDDVTNKYFYDYASMEKMSEIPDYVVAQTQYIVDKKAAVISISAPTPGLMKDVDPRKMQARNKASFEKMSFYQKHLMGNGSQWLVVAYPTKAWADKVFPNDKKSFEKLLDAILMASRVTDTNNPVSDWEKHMKELADHNKKLNDYDFKYLHFKNSIGTDLKVELVEGHIWAGGGEESKGGVYFAPNIPTEETFTMPHKFGTNGKVVATKPLNYQGKLVENFYLVFEEGKVVDFGAEKEYEALKGLLELDEGSSRLGEVALISHDSPISNTNILFFNTLFDENASCHLALGNAYPMNIKGGLQMEEAELLTKGYNKSMAHVDFMFGSDDMEITGYTKDGKDVAVFKKGNFVF